MANTLTDVIPQILAQGLLQLRQQAIMPRLVNTDYSREAAEKGDTVDIPLPATISAGAVTAAATPPSTSDITPTKVSISLDQWYEAPFHLSDKDIAEAMDGVVPMQVSSAITALAENVNAAVLALYKDVYSVSGTFGTTPFASTYGVASEARKYLNTQLAPMSPRYAVLDPDAEEKAINLAAFADSGFTSESGVILEGVIGRKLGMDWFMDQQVPTHTPGTLTDGTGMLALVDDAAYTVGESTVDIDETSLSGTVVIGDIFTVAGDTQQYVVTANATAASNAIAGMAFKPASKVAWADNAQITFYGGATGATAHTANLVFHRDAFALATRPLEAPGDGLGSLISSTVDPVSGLALRLEVSREHKRTRWAFDILYGVKTIRAELATRIAG